jgi:CheY-like chemotaxis protein
LVEHALAGTIEVDWSCAEQVDNLFVDRPQLELALVNLILNARDAMPAGGRINVAIDEMEVDPTADQFTGRFIRISVSDQGRNRWRHHRSDYRNLFTTGVRQGHRPWPVDGRRLHQQSGGKLQINSRPGEGTTVELILPSTASQLRLKRQSGSPPLARSTKAVLLVDDDEVVRTVLGEQLREMGFAVDEVSDGSSAIERRSAMAATTCC